MFGFPKNAPFLKWALDATRENCLTYKVCGVLSGAGPGFLTAAIVTYQPENVLYIEQRYLIQKRAESIMYQTSDSTWQNENGTIRDSDPSKYTKAYNKD